VLGGHAAWCPPARDAGLVLAVGRGVSGDWHVRGHCFCRNSPPGPTGYDFKEVGYWTADVERQHTFAADE